MGYIIEYKLQFIEDDDPVRCDLPSYLKCDTVEEGLQKINNIIKRHSSDRYWPQQAEIYYLRVYSIKKELIEYQINK